MTPATPPSLLVTGGGRGIGRAVALRFAREGWGVAVLARSRSELAETAALVAKAGGKALAIEGDVSKEADGETAVKRTEEAFGGVDVLVNNAGVFKVKAAHETPTELWRQILETNLSGPFFVTRAVIRGMLARKRGRAIVNVSSEAGKKGFPGSGAYCASKYGLCGFGDAIREELRPAGIRVINVLPGQVDTKAWDGCGLDLDRIGLRRDKMMKPEQVADAIAHAVLAEGAVAEEILLKPI
ncbi:MAG TPA: SDR family oxidoreductase [Planctomycetota bacterium]|jgi:NAD(P)-dependent dehydrogenase (short-subunit alcohol dehydrogenase family)|nr:SDR family oxidoreductase [Planctomycetota bacterium]